MNLRPSTAFIERTINFCSNFGGLGDSLAKLTAVKWIKENHVHVRMTVYWHDYFVELAKLLVPESEMLRHKSFTDMKLADTSIPLLDFTPESLNSLRFHLTDYAFIRLAQCLPPNKEAYVYPRFRSRKALPIVPFSNYVIVTPLATSATRVWQGKYINEFLIGCKAQGIKTVLLGKTEDVPHGNGIKIMGKPPGGFDASLADLNLIDQLTLEECLEVMDRARAIVGIDNGLLHLAACTDTPAVWGFTSVEKHLRLPHWIRTEVVEPEVSCYGCQNKCYLVKHNFTKCLYEDPKTGKGYECLDEMKGEKFLQALNKILVEPT